MEPIAGDSRFFRALRCLALVGAALSACATPGTSTDSYDLVLNAPGLETVQPEVVVTHVGDYSSGQAEHMEREPGHLATGRPRDLENQGCVP